MDPNCVNLAGVGRGPDASLYLASLSGAVYVLKTVDAGLAQLLLRLQAVLAVHRSVAPISGHRHEQFRREGQNTLQHRKGRRTDPYREADRWVGWVLKVGPGRGGRLMVG